MQCRTPVMIVSALLAAVVLAACTPPSERLRLVTGPQGGTWYPLGGAMKSILEGSLEGISVQVLPGGGIANVLAVEKGQAQIGFANSVSTVDAINGEPPFDFKATQVCNVATLYPQYFQAVTLADAGIRNPEDLRGKVLSTQVRGNTGEAITVHLLRAYGMSYDDLARVNYGSYTDSVTLMKDGNADVFTLGTSIPAGAVMDLASARTISLLHIPDDGIARMRRINAGYAPTVIPAGTYPEQEKEVQTIGYATHVIARCDLADELVYGILDSMYNRLDDLASIARAVKRTTAQSMGIDIGVPMHGGALNWYREKGVL